MEFRILGPLEVERRRAGSSALGSGRQLALVAVLLLHATRSSPSTGSSTSSGAGAAADRGEDRPQLRLPAPQGARRPARHAAARLPAARRGGRAGQPAPRARGRERRPRRADARARALARRRRSSQFAYERFAQTEIARLEELRLAALEKRDRGASSRSGGTRALSPSCEALVQQHPLRERLCGPADARALPVGPAGRGARGVPADAARSRRGARHRARPRAARARAQDPEPGPVARAHPSRPPGRAPSPRAAPRRRCSRSAASRCSSRSRRVLAGRATPRAASASCRPNSVGVIDPGTNAIVAAIPVGIRPGPVAAGAGSVWVGNLQDQNLTRIDPQRRAPSGTVRSDNRTPTGLAIGAGAVWVAHGRKRRALARRARSSAGSRTRSPSPRRRTRRPTAASRSARATSGRVFGDSTLARDGSRRPCAWTGIALAGASRAAVVARRRGGLGRQRRRRDRPALRPDDVRGGPDPLGERRSAAGRTRVRRGCASGSRTRATTRSRASTRARARPSTIQVGDEPVGVAVGAGAMWVANTGDGTVSRIDPATNEVERTIERRQPRPAGIAVADGLVWVAAQAPLTLLRGRRRRGRTES